MRFFRNNYYLDLRSLGVFRFFLGLCVIFDLLDRLVDIPIFYTQDGIYPAHIWTEYFAQGWNYSFHTLFDSYPFVLGLFLIHILISLFFTFGIRTKISSILLFLFTASMHNRNWVINSGGDDVLRVILFICMFLPLGACFSVDGAKRKTGDYKFFSAFSVFYILQLGFIYYFSSIQKNHPIWYQDFDAIYYALSLDIFRYYIGELIYPYPSVLKFLTGISIYIEWLGSVLVLFPFLLWFLRWYLRLFLCLIFLGFQVGIITTLDVGTFSFTLFACWLAYLPCEFWDRILSRSKEKVTIFYDGECGFCRKGVYILRSFLFLDSDIKQAQSEEEILELMNEKNSWIVQSGSDSFLEFDAFSKLLSHSPFCFLTFLTNLKLIRFCGTKLYRLVSHNRKKVSKITKYLTLKDYNHSFYHHIVTTVIGAFMLVMVLLWNLQTVPKLDFVNSTASSVVRHSQVFQNWNMFAPFPLMYNVWMNFKLHDEDGTIHDFNHLGDGDEKTQQLKFIEWSNNKQWKKFVLILFEKGRDLNLFNRFLCLNGEKLTGKKIVKVHAYVMSQKTLLDYKKDEVSMHSHIPMVCSELTSWSWW